MSQPAQSGNYVADSLPNMPAVAPIQVGSNGSPGGYKFDPDQVQNVINKWQELLSDLEDDQQSVRILGSVSPPGQEFASGSYMDKGYNPSTQTLAQQNQRMIEYVQNYIKALQQASGKIQQNEADQQRTIANQGGDNSW